ncbi:MAG: LysM peptidoglycan-binding domain-containing protein [Gammaproteobacteria bacterium]
MSKKAVSNGLRHGLLVLLLAALAGCGQPAVRQYSTQLFTHHPAPEPAQDTAGVDLDAATEPTTDEVIEDGYAHALERMRAGFQLPETSHARLDRQIAWYQQNPATLRRALDRADPFLGWILDQLEARGMPAELALLPVIESGYHPLAYSPSHASGLWQFMPSTGARFGLKQDWWYDGRRDVVASTEAALDYLNYLHDEFHGDWLLALAAYNAGEGTVGRALRRNRERGLPEDYWHLELPGETQIYVPKLLALRDIVATPGHYGIDLPDLDAAPRIALVETAGQIDLGLAANLAGVPVADVRRLNPGLNRGTTAPNGPHQLVIPIEAAERFATHIAALPADKRVTWQRHQVNRGDTLSTIAKRYDTSVALLRQANNLSGNTLKPGKHLLIPVARTRLADFRLAALREQAERQSAAAAKKRTKTYQVRSGDTLWGLARRHNTSITQLVRANGISASQPLRPGQTLEIDIAAPATQKTAAAKTRGAAKRATAPAGRQSLQYTVRQGDSLYQISRRYRVTVSDLRQWNGLGQGHHLRPGQKLTLYVDTSLQADGRDG